MKTSKIYSKCFELITFLYGSLFVFLTSCGSNKLQISEYNFVYNGNSYVVRSSYCQNNPKSCNHLIGDNFIAVDLNQDRIMDKVTKGNISLLQVQEIYEYCLKQLEEKGKLTEIDKKNNEFIFEEENFSYIIKSFSTTENSFNEFTITNGNRDLKKQIVSMFVDYNADGNLDEFLKGGILLEDAQQMYNRIIEKGIELGKLHKVNKNVFVK